MPRKGYVQKREVMPDPVCNDRTVTKLISNIMLGGKKGTAQKIVYGAFNIIKETTGEGASEVFYGAMNDITPILEVKTRRIDGANYRVPTGARLERRQTLGLGWLTTYVRARGEETMVEKLAKEIMDTANNTGVSVKKREDVHKMAETNKVLVCYRY